MQRYDSYKPTGVNWLGEMMQYISQWQTLTFLTIRLVRIDHSIEIVEMKINLLQERKQIIINEVVTGKVRVG